MNIASDEHANINVIVRVRGRSKQEIKSGSSVIVKIPSSNSSPPPSSTSPHINQDTESKLNSLDVPTEICINTTNETGIVADISSKTFTIDKAYGPETDQYQFFQGTAAPLFDEFLKGYNCTMFAYGQTGAGKTYTMYGDEKHSCFNVNPNAGIIPRIIYSLFDKLGNMNEQNNRKLRRSDCHKSHSKSDFIVKCSFLELYNEELRDLFAIDDSKKLRIFEQQARSITENLGTSTIQSNSRCNIVTQNLEEITLKNADHAMKILEQGLKKRQVAATKLNDVSSRSHTIFTIYLYKSTHYNKAADDNDDTKSLASASTSTSSLSSMSSSNEFRVSKFNLVDLAGSENIGRSGAVNQRAREAGSINQSLLTLGRVINGLVDGESHIPYRESKLTRLLQDSLGGKTKTVLIANVSPAKMNMEETLSTLQYASKAKNIRNQPQIGTLIMKNMLVKDLATEVARLKADLNATRLKNGIFIDKDNYNELHKNMENLNTENLEYKTKIESLQRQMAGLQNELKVITNTISSKDDEIANSKEVIHDLHTNLTEKITTNEGLISESISLKENIKILNRNITQLIENKTCLTNQIQNIMNNDIKNSNLELQVTINKLLEVSKTPKAFLEQLKQVKQMINSEFSNFNNKISLVSEKINNLLISKLPNSFDKIIGDLKVLEGISYNMEHNIKDNYSNVLGLLSPQCLENNSMEKKNGNNASASNQADLILVKLQKEFHDNIEKQIESKENDLIHKITKLIKDNNKHQRLELFNKFSIKNNEMLMENFNNLENEKNSINKQVKDNFRKIHNELMNDITSSKTNFQSLYKYLNEPVNNIDHTSNEIQKVISNLLLADSGTLSSQANVDVPSVDIIIDNLKLDVLKDYTIVDNEQKRLSNISKHFQKMLSESSVSSLSEMKQPNFMKSGLSSHNELAQVKLGVKENVEIYRDNNSNHNNQPQIRPVGILKDRNILSTYSSTTPTVKKDESFTSSTRSSKKRCFQEVQSSNGSNLSTISKTTKNLDTSSNLRSIESNDMKESILNQSSTKNSNINKMRRLKDNSYKQPSKLPIFTKKSYDAND